MNLASLTGPELIFPSLRAADRHAVLRHLAEAVVASGHLDDADELHRRLEERESLGSTGIGSGVAIPHCKLTGLDHVLLAVAVTDRPVSFGAVDGEPVRLFFLVVSPHDAPAAHLQCLAAISRWVKADAHAEEILDLESSAAIYRLLGGGEG